MQNKKGSALIITLMITIIISLIAIYLLDKIVPISRNVKGIENGNIAYYSANSGIEEALLTMSGADPSIENSADTHLTSSTGYSFQITATGKIIPMLGEGNSEYDTNWNKIGPGQAVQLLIPNGIEWDDVNFYFRVPDLDGNGSLETLSGVLDGSGMINWILAGSGVNLYASGNSDMIRGSEINNTNLGLSGRSGIDLNGSGGTFKQFYEKIGNFSSNGLGVCNYTDKKCTLKLSIVNPLLLDDNNFAPYLEYKIDGLDISIPLQNAKIESDGYSFGFKKHIRRDVQQITTNEALDFTVSQ